MRENLADEVADRLRGMVADGLLEPGTRINEVHLAGRLGVSRTPLREALSRLVRDGFVESRARRGFFVQRLDALAVRELYEMRAILDPAALDLAGLPPGTVLGRLEQLNAAIGRADRSIERLIDLDDAWHLELVGGCPNRLVLDLIRRYMQRTRALERAYLREHRNVDRMVEEHDVILWHLRRGDLDGGVNALRQNMRSGMAPILAWFEAYGVTPRQLRRT